MSSKQKIFQEMILGTLLYAVVLGFFEEYTGILSTWSYSITFLAAVVLQLLTYATLLLKKRVTHYFQQKDGPKYTVAMIFSVWLILFLSKFVFLAVIESIFGSSVTISGFIGLLLIIISMTGLQKGVELFYKKLQ